MPFIPNRIEAICGARVNYMPLPQDQMITVKTELGGKGDMCAGCTFDIDYRTGRITLTNTDKYRDCLEEKAPIANRSTTSK
jgi:hypothetical protein